MESTRHSSRLPSESSLAVGASIRVEMSTHITGMYSMLSAAAIIELEPRNVSESATTCNYSRDEAVATTDDRYSSCTTAEKTSCCSGAK